MSETKKLNMFLKLEIFSCLFGKGSLQFTNISLKEETEIKMGSNYRQIDNDVNGWGGTKSKLKYTENIHFWFLYIEINKI